MEPCFLGSSWASPCWWEVEKLLFSFPSACSFCFIKLTLSWPMSHVIFSLHPAEEGCDRADWWAPGIQPKSTHHNDTESHTSYLSLYLVHQIGSTQKSCEYRSFTLAKTTLIACFFLPPHLFCSCLHIAESCSLWGTRGVGLHLYFYLSMLKPRHKTSLYRDFWPLVEYGLRQQWNRYAWWH